MFGALLLLAILLIGLLSYFVSRSVIKPIFVLKDATERIKEGNLDFQISVTSHDEIGQLNQGFEEMRKKLKESIEVQTQYEENRKELISNISHDLKTPITSIIGYVEGIKDGVANTPEKMDKYLTTIHTKARHMDTLIDELFLFSKLDLNRVPFQFETVELNMFMQELIEEMQMDLSKEGIEIHLQLHASPQYVTADCEKINRVISNLIHNSVKYMDKEEKKITVTVSSDNNKVIVKVMDNGSGIESDTLPYIFERFYRAEQSRNSSTGGSGLGLAIAKQIVEEHGGEIWAESELGKGTSIFFSLKKYRNVVSRMKRILLVEDEISIAELQRDYLEISDFQVDVEHSGETGLQRALQEDYDLIILDIMLPKMNGFEICKQIRAIKDIPILLVSAKKKI